MSNGLKIALWVIGSVTVLLIIGVLAVTFLFTPFTNFIDETIAYGKNHSKEECLLETSKKLKGCDDVYCLAPKAGFAAACIQGAQGTTEEFCQDKPHNSKDFSKGNWQRKYCTEYDLTKDACDIIFTSITNVCGKQ